MYYLADTSMVDGAFLRGFAAATDTGLVTQKACASHVGEVVSGRCKDALPAGDIPVSLPTGALVCTTGG